MGAHDIQKSNDKNLREFTFHLLRDVRALEQMLEHGLIESGKSRIGAEQELFLVDKNLHPACKSVEALALIQNDHYTPELMQFNLEFNLSPLSFNGDCLSRMETEIQHLIEIGRHKIASLGLDFALTGILPTIRLADLPLENLTPKPRYFELNNVLNEMRGGPFECQIHGPDELLIKHDTVTLEGCNTSFQCHFQVSPDNFVKYYNITQLVAAPLMAIATNSPLLFGKRLWRETRIALFQQSIDTRTSDQYLRELSPRVHFGNDWVHDSVLEIYKEDISRFRIIFTESQVEDPFEVLAKGEVPKLKALQLHNGTVYRWNRACYGVFEGKAHLRIENRIIPSGPTPLDEVANAAFWFGLVSGMGEDKRYANIKNEMPFDEVRSNFYECARLGLQTELRWLDGKRISTAELILNELIPIARKGLTKSHINPEDIDRYLSVIEERTKSRQTGAQWMIDSLASFKDGTRAEKMAALVKASINREKTGKPVHEWALAQMSEVGFIEGNFEVVEQFMTTDLFTIQEDELIDLVATMMVWKKIRTVLVEDRDHKLVGIVSQRNIIKYVVNNPNRDIHSPTAVREIMTPNPISVSPETTSLEAIRIMKEKNFSSLPVVRNGALVGIVTEVDFMKIAAGFLEENFQK